MEYRFTVSDPVESTPCGIATPFGIDPQWNRPPVESTPSGIDPLWNRPPVELHPSGIEPWSEIDSTGAILTRGRSTVFPSLGPAYAHARNRARGFNREVNRRKSSDWLPLFA